MFENSKHLGIRVMGVMHAYYVQQNSISISKLIQPLPENFNSSLSGKQWWGKLLGSFNRTAIF